MKRQNIEILKIQIMLDRLWIYGFVPVSNVLNIKLFPEVSALSVTVAFSRVGVVEVLVREEAEEQELQMPSSHFTVCTSVEMDILICASRWIFSQTGTYTILTISCPNVSVNIIQKSYPWAIVLLFDWHPLGIFLTPELCLCP
jgi:hypothetical protein